MANIYDIIKGIIETAGYTAYFLRKPETSVKSCVVYRRISSKDILTHSGQSGLKKDRFQFTCIAKNETDLKTLIDGVESAFTLNRVNFELCTPTESLFENYEDGNFFSTRDYFIWYKPS